MIMDATTLFSNAQAVTATAVSANIVDLGATGTVYGAAAAIVRDIGRGAAVPLKVTVVESFNNLTSLTISVETDDNIGFASAKTVWSSPTYALTDLATGAKLLLPDSIPLGTDERYVRLRYTIAGTAPTLGKITAGVTAGNQTNG
ncbi:Bbp16 family capsid cement protein [Sphingomonas sp. ERG5]|uniref:Bbp16 family capsid cement protein n=1 Tax=Sphingomonas sp. ERG5 TaxID=1381597 RepID=UPI00054BA2E6|nr:hypothetical protein [Sphingomonas sp. ERG5]